MNNLYKIILINLDKDKARLAYVKNQLDNLYLPFERLEAINGKEYMEKDGSEYDEKLTIKELGIKLTTGEIGCALSHKRCYQKFLNDPEYNDTKYLLILEDDITFHKDFKKILEEEIKKNEENHKWNYLQFNYPKNDNLFNLFISFSNKFYIQYIDIKNRVGILNKIKRIPYLFLSPIISFLLSIRYFLISKSKGIYRFIFKIHTLTGCYLIDKKVAESLLELTSKIIFAADITIAIELYKYKKVGLNFYFYSPLLVKQNYNDFESNIEHEML